MRGKGASPFVIAKEVINQKGFTHLYTGLSAAMFRQITYASVRFGLYYTLQDMSMKRKGPGVPMPFYERITYSLVSGAVGAYVGVPPDLSLIRMQSDIHLPPEQKRGYKNVFDAMYRISKEEGVLNMWRGSTPTIMRAIAMNIGMLGPYDAGKDFLARRFGEFDGLRFVASC